MREIIFRGWDEKNKEMVYNINLLFSNRLNDCFEEYEECGLKIMQYTGLKDKNGKRIFEGDVVASMNGAWMGTVVYQAPKFVIKQKSQSKTWYEFSLSPEENQFQEVIGNIHEGVQE